MSKPNIKFYRSQSAPTNPQEGLIWFDTDLRAIKLYKNGDWEVYTKVLNIEETGTKKYTVTKNDGSTFVIDLSGIASDSLVTELQNSLNEHLQEFETEKGKIATLQGEMTTVKEEVAKLSDITGKVGAYVVEKISVEENARKAADENFEGRIAALEGVNVDTKISDAIGALDNGGVTGTGSYVDVAVTQVDGKVTGVSVIDTDLGTAFEGIQSSIDTEKGRIDTLIGKTAESAGDAGKSIRAIATDVLTEVLVSEDASEAYDTLQEMSAWLKEHPENAASMESAISANTTAVGTLTTDVETLKTGVQTINTTIEENEKTVAAALTELNNSIVALETSVVTSVSGNGYVSATKSDNDVVVTVTTGSVADGGDALVTASDVKSYVDNCYTWAEF